MGTPGRGHCAGPPARHESTMSVLYDEQPTGDDACLPQTRPSHDAKDEPTTSRHDETGPKMKALINEPNLDVLLIPELSATAYRTHDNHSTGRLY